jgi:hypothetical protein
MSVKEFTALDLCEPSLKVRLASGVCTRAAIQARLRGQGQGGGARGVTAAPAPSCVGRVVHVAASTVEVVGVSTEPKP